MDAGGAVLDADGLRLAVLPVDFDAAETRQDVRHPAVHQAGLVELGLDLHRQPEPAPGGQQPIQIGQRPHEIAAELHHRADFAFDNRLGRLGAVQSLSVPAASKP